MDDLTANRLRIMIVENDRVTARDLDSTLHRRGFLVTALAHSAEEALGAARSNKPDLALLDIALNDREDGIDLAIRLREEYEVPSIFVTGYSEEALFERARKARPAAFLRKPFSEAELVACLEAAAERTDTAERLSHRIPGLDAVSRQLPQAVIASDLAGNVVYLNPAAESLLGWSSEEARRNTTKTVVPLREAGESVAEGPVSAKIVDLTTRTGEWKRVEERSGPIKSGEGDAIGLVTVLTEIEAAPEWSPPPSQTPGPPSHAPQEATPPLEETELASAPRARTDAIRKIAELARSKAYRDAIGTRKSPPPLPAETEGPAAVVAVAAPETGEIEESQTTATASPTPLLEDVAEPLLKIEEDGTIEYANAEAVSVFGDGSLLAGKRLQELFAEADTEAAEFEQKFFHPLQDGLRHRFDFQDSRRAKWYEVRVYRTNGGVLALFHDNTATRIETAEQVRQQRLEGLGLLARGFAHDFNNHLTTLTGNISLARERHQDDDELQTMLDEAQSAATRATGLVQQLMTFARGGRPIRERTRVSDLIRRILTEHRILHPEIRYQFQGSENELVANVDPAQVGRLIENLVSNSAAAMIEGGVLIVRVSSISPEEVLHIRSSHTPAEEDHLLIEVIDTGHGMSEDNLSRVFDPYFTTRKEDNATGIGLTVCESIAKAHGGFIHLQSKVGKGTIATFCAPLGRRSASVREDADVPAYPNFNIPNLAPRPAGGAEGENLLVGTRILILEDDAPIRRLMAATLRRAGHEVVETKDGAETIAIYRDALEKNQRFHLLICDLTIESGVGGVETMRRLLEIDPDVLAIVSSGYSDAPAMSSPAAFGFRGVLPKPYAPSELRAAVHRILAAHHIIS